MTDSPCATGKVRHPSRAAARRFGGRLPFSHGRHRAYLCDECSGWHLTLARAENQHERRHAPPPRVAPPVVATREELDAWWAEHGGTP